MEQKEGGLRFAVKISFLLLIFSLGFMQPNIEIRGAAVPVTDLLFLITGFLWVLALVFRKIEFRFDKFYFLLGLYAAGLLISASLSENPQFSLFKYLGELYLIGLTVMTFNLARTSEMRRKVIVVWLIASGLAALIGVLTVASFYLGLTNVVTDFSLHYYGTLPAGNYPRIQSTFLYPSVLCNYLTVSLLMLLAALRLKWIGNALFTCLMGLFAVAIAFTVTPGVGGIFVAVGLWFWLVFKENGRPSVAKIILSGGITAGIGFIAISAIAIFGASPSGPINLLGVQIEPAARLLTWHGAFQTFLEHPLFGKGLGLAVANVTFIAPSTGLPHLLADAHNTLLNLAGQTGIAGTIPLILIIVAVGRRLNPINVGRDESSTLRVCLGIAFVSAFIYQGLVGSFEDTRHLWVLIGLIVAIPKAAES